MRFVKAIKWVARTAPVAGLIWALAWIATAMLAAACFYSLTQRIRSWYDTDELLGYAAAFTVAGALSGPVAVAMRGRWKLATATFAWLLLLLAAATVMLLRYPTAPWLFSGFSLVRAYQRVAAALEIGLRIGLPAGLVVSACVVAIEPLLRRGRRWALGVVAALGVVVATGWGINDAVMWIGRQGFDESFRIRREVVWGAACGAIVGALVAALLGGMIALAAARRRRRAELLVAKGSGAPARQPGPMKVQVPSTAYVPDRIDLDGDVARQ